MAIDGVFILQLRQDAVRQLFTQLYAPLIEAVDIQNSALGEDLVLIQCNQRAQAIWRDRSQQDGVGWAVTFKHLEWHDVRHVRRRFTGHSKLFFHFRSRFTKGQRLGLSKEVRHQFGVVITQRIMAHRWRDKVTRDHLGALVDQLIERVLTVGTRLTPDNRAGLVIHRLTVAIHILTVGLHVALLEVSRKTVHVLIVWQNRFSFSAIEIVVPQANQRQQYRQVVRQLCFGEVTIHRMRAGQQLLEIIKTNRQRNRQTDRRPQGITATDPIPELEHVGGIDTECRDRAGVGRQRSKVLGHMRLPGGALQEPLTGAQGVGHGLLRGEGLGGHQEQRGLGIQTLQRFGDMSAIHVRNKVHVQVIFVRLKCLGHHVRTQVRTTDTDIHHIGDRFAGVTGPLPADHFVAKRFHLSQYRINLRHHVLTIDHNWRVATVTQRHVQHRPIFGAVNFVPTEHGGNRLWQLGLVRQRQQVLHS